MGEFIENTGNVKSCDGDQSDEISQSCCVLPNSTFDEPNILVDTSYYEEINHHELLQVEANWREVEMALDEEIIDDDNDDADVTRGDDNDD